KLQTYKDKIKTSEYTYSVFDSPSGNGLKIIVKIPPSLEEHTDYFYGLEDYYDSEFFDKTSRNLSRICFISYDPDIYINKDSKVFDR
ncbi:BT4734/BF3469 family protein, partial [Streptomyces caeruleatus]